jgi:homoserine O-acetyltransferase/O-succinyltransferase
MKTLVLNESLQLENGGSIKDLRIAYHSYGTLNDNRDNVIWVCHALTANSDVLDWWEGLFGANRLFDPEKYFIVCANVLGSCYGTSGPNTPLSEQRPLFNAFPEISIRDMVQLHEKLSEKLQIKRIHLLIGASLGGQQALEWSILRNDLIENLVLIATNASHSAYGRAFNESQRMAIYSDPTYGTGAGGGKEGLKVARSIALLSYRSYKGYELTQSELSDDFPKNDYRAATYQRYQGEKLARRFSAYSYVLLSKAMDSHNVGRNRGGVSSALKQVKAKTLVVGISSDQLFPVGEQQYLAASIPNARYVEIDSDFGHDGFLIETDELTAAIRAFQKDKLQETKPIVRTAFRNRAEVA